MLAAFRKRVDDSVRCDSCEDEEEDLYEEEDEHELATSPEDEISDYEMKEDHTVAFAPLGV